MTEASPAAPERKRLRPFRGQLARLARVLLSGTGCFQHLLRAAQIAVTASEPAGDGFLQVQDILYVRPQCRLIQKIPQADEGIPGARRHGVIDMRRGAVHQGCPLLREAHSVQAVRIGRAVEVFYFQSRLFRRLSHTAHQCALANARPSFEVEHPPPHGRWQDVSKMAAKSLGRVSAGKIVNGLHRTPPSKFGSEKGYATEAQQKTAPAACCGSGSLLMPT